MPLRKAVKISFHMTKAISFFLFSIVIFQNAKSQNSDYGMFSDYEQNYTTCEFDKDADAVQFFDVATAIYNDYYNLIIERRIRFKILTEKGVSRANIQIPFYSKDDFEKITDVKATVETPTGEGKFVTKELHKSDVYTKLYNERISLLKFALPNVHVGSIIEYKYISTSKHYGALNDWIFQTDMPTLFSKFDIDIVPNTEFAYVVHKKNYYPISINTKKEGKVIFEMTNLPGLYDEPYIDARKDYLQRVEFQLSKYKTVFGSDVDHLTKWIDVPRNLLTDPDFGKLIDKKIPSTEIIIAKSASFSKEEDKMKFIFETVRNTMSWNEMNGKYAYEGIKKAWEKKVGSSAEINLILINLLKTSGIIVSPMLVSERSFGKVETSYPILDQFNKVVAYVSIGSKHYVLDATDKYTPPDLIPFELLNTNAFVVSMKNEQVIVLKEDDRFYTNKISITATISNEGLASGNADIFSHDYAKVERAEYISKGKDRFINKFIINSNKDIGIDSIAFTNLTDDSVDMNQKLKFTMPLTKSGNYFMLNTNLFSGLEKNIFIADNRFSPINFGIYQITEILENFIIPSTMKLTELPKNIKITTPDKSLEFIRIVSLESDKLHVEYLFKINRPFFDADEYPMLKDFYKKIFNSLTEQIVLSKI